MNFVEKMEISAESSAFTFGKQQFVSCRLLNCRYNILTCIGVIHHHQYACSSGMNTSHQIKFLGLLHQLALTAQAIDRRLDCSTSHKPEPPRQLSATPLSANHARPPESRTNVQHLRQFCRQTKFTKYIFGAILCISVRAMFCNPAPSTICSFCRTELESGDFWAQALLACARSTWSAGARCVGGVFSAASWQTSDKY